ncbi:MAG: peptide chain release factor N(5)-glutamine methyltransferase [Sulfurospirillum sp.]
MPSIRELLEHGSNKLREVTQNPQKEALRLLAFSLQVECLWLISHDDFIVDEPKDFLENIDKRANFYPLEYILKETSFYSKMFYTDDRVLIPRPETEILIDKVFSICRDMKKPIIAEVGAGSGIISVMLSTLLPDVNIIATDISQDALEVAKINANRHRVEDRIRFVRTNLLEGINEKIDILVSNPPYIKDDEKLDKNLSYEPDLALFGGNKGDEILRCLIDEAIKRDVKVLACEMGYDQKEKINNYLKNHNLSAEFYKDLAGIDRGFVLNP